MAVPRRDRPHIDLQRSLDEPPSEILIRKKPSVKQRNFFTAVPRHGLIQAAHVAKVLHYQVPAVVGDAQPIDSTVNFALTNFTRRLGLITLIVIIVFVWTIIRIVRFVNQLWSNTDATGSARIGVATAA
jgi:hypothetical protein